jgi:hypothetical protein
VLLLQTNGIGTALLAATVTSHAAIVRRPAIAAGVTLHKPAAVETRQVQQMECAPLVAGPGAGATVPIYAQRTRRALRAPRAWTVAGAATFVSTAQASGPSTGRAITSGSGYTVIVPLTNALRTRLAVAARNERTVVGVIGLLMARRRVAFREIRQAQSPFNALRRTGMLVEVGVEGPRHAVSFGRPCLTSMTSVTITKYRLEQISTLPVGTVDATCSAASASLETPSVISLCGLDGGGKAPILRHMLPSRSPRLDPGAYLWLWGQQR